MPFGRKADAGGRPTDFDAVYQQIIAPAVFAAELEPIRADEEQIGGTIHKPMFERFMLCDYAVADMTGANPNVYYELGIRHAMRPRSTVVLFAEGTTLPFDLALLRGLPYKTAGGLPMTGVLAAGSPSGSARTDPPDDSPLFQLITHAAPRNRPPQDRHVPRPVDYSSSTRTRLAEAPRSRARGGGSRRRTRARQSARRRSRRRDRPVPVASRDVKGY